MGLVFTAPQCYTGAKGREDVARAGAWLRAVGPGDATSGCFQRFLQSLKPGSVLCYSMISLDGLGQVFHLLEAVPHRYRGVNR